MSSRSALAKIPPLHAPLIPPMGSVMCGTTPDGKQLYTLTRKMARKVPDIDEKTKERRWRKVISTGEPLYPLNKPEIYDDTEMFFLESDGRNNVTKQKYTPPTAQELADQDRQRKIAAMQPALAQALVDSGLTAEELVARLMAPASSQPSAAAAPELSVSTGGSGEADEAKKDEPVVTYPRQVGGNNWELSNGSRVKGNRQKAQEAEDAITPEERTAMAEAKLQADLVPES